MDEALIFGGTGFIGRHLSRWLCRRGTRRIVVADVVPPAERLPESVEFVECDVRRPISINVGPEAAVFNLAAVHRTPGHEDHEYFETNVAGARHVVDLCERAGTDRLFFTSSIAVYGPSEEPTTETTPPRPTIAYGRSKLEAENVQRAWAEAAPRRRLVVVRPGTVFGPGEGGNFTRLAQALAKRRFVYPGRRDTVKACGYVEDLIESMWFAESLASPTVTYNFGLAQPPTIEDVCSAFCRIAGYPPPRIVAPTPVMLAAAATLRGLGATTFHPERVLKLVRSTHIVPKVLIEEGYPYSFDLEAALSDWYAQEPKGHFV